MLPNPARTYRTVITYVNDLLARMHALTAPQIRTAGVLSALLKEQVTSKFTPRFYSSKSLNMASVKAAHDFLSFVNSSPTPFHAVHNLKQQFARAGYTEIKERNDWSNVCKPGGKVSAL